MTSAPPSRSESGTIPQAGNPARVMHGVYECCVLVQSQMLSVIGSRMSSGHVSTCTQRVLSARVYSLGLLGPQCVLFACMCHALLTALTVVFFSRPMVGVGAGT